MMEVINNFIATVYTRENIDDSGKSIKKKLFEDEVSNE